MNITLFAGDITEAPAEALCTSTNPRLSLMMGTGGAVRERGGFEVLRECETIVEQFGRPLPAGSVHVTSAGSLPYKGVLHCVASGAEHVSSADIIRICVKNALAAADAKGFTTLAMPVFATGHAHFRFDRSMAVIAETLRAAQTNVREVVIVVDEEHADDAQQLLSSRA